MSTETLPMSTITGSIFLHEKSLSQIINFIKGQSL